MVVILSVLTAIAIPLFLSQKQKSVDAGLKSDLRNAAATQETYFVDHGTYADTVELTELKQLAGQQDHGRRRDRPGASASQGSNDNAGSAWNYSSTTGMITSGACA